ncbi:MAG: EAL domain-containing protein [Lachnospiraceae bacterium]|nr:EAL domain-containing protein [Lachnospiraceae bacterium]
MGNYDFEIAALFIYLFSGFSVVSKKGFLKRQNRIMMLLLLCCVLGTIASLTNYVESLTSNYVLSEIALYFYHLIHCQLAFLLALYMMELTGVWDRLNKFQWALLYLPDAVFMILLLTNAFHHMTFTFENGVYARGPFLIMEYVAAVIYVIYSLYLLFSRASYLGIMNLTGTILFIVVSLVGIVYQMLNPKVHLEAYMEAVGLFGMLITVENERELVDLVTNLFNRSTFIKDNLKRSRNLETFDVFYIKLTNYRHLSSALGVLTMNNVIREIADFIDHIDKKNMTAYYCENGVFALVGENISKEQAQAVKDVLSMRFGQPMPYKEITIPFSTQLFHVRYPDQVSDVEDLLNLVDAEFRSNDSAITIYEDDDINFIKREASIEMAVKRALDNNGFQVYYQPIWDSEEGRIRSAEALIRLNDPDMGFIPPDEFIPVAEKNGMINDIGLFVFETVCKNIKELNFDDLGIDFVEVNLSPIQCMQADLDMQFEAIMKKYGVKSDQINLEITETAASESPEMFLDMMKQLSKMGFHFSLDDYGTGFANLSYMFDLDFLIIKIDKSILWNAEKSAAAKIILDHTIHMIKEMNRFIVTEGVETEEQKNYLRDAGCHFCQGFYFSKPIPNTEFVEFCKKFNGVA